MNYAILSTELSGDPLGRSYSGMSDAEAAADLNTEYRTQVQSLSMQGLREWAATGARGFKIQAAITNEALTDQQRNVAYVGDKLLGTDDAQLDPSNAGHVAFVNELVSAGIITSDDRAALVTKATVNLSRATELGLPFVYPGHVQDARA